MADEDAEEVDDNYLLFARMEAGLYTAQQACRPLRSDWSSFIHAAAACIMLVCQKCCPSSSD